MPRVLRRARHALRGAVVGVGGSRAASAARRQHGGGKCRPGIRRRKVARASGVLLARVVRSVRARVPRAGGPVGRRRGDRADGGGGRRGGPRGSAPRTRRREASKSSPAFGRGVGRKRKRRLVADPRAARRDDPRGVRVSRGHGIDHRRVFAGDRGGSRGRRGRRRDCRRARDVRRRRERSRSRRRKPRRSRRRGSRAVSRGRARRVRVPGAPAQGGRASNDGGVFPSFVVRADVEAREEKRGRRVRSSDARRERPRGRHRRGLGGDGLDRVRGEPEPTKRRRRRNTSR